MAAFLDTNVILRHLIGDHPEHSPRASAYLRRVELREIEVHLADTVVFETVFTLERFYKVDKVHIRDVLLPLLDLSGVLLPGKSRYEKVFDLYIQHNLSFADAYHAVLAQHLGLTQIVSFDRGLDRVADITRVEP
jgi:predicted nucleic acid-binding protein